MKKNFFAVLIVGLLVLASCEYTPVTSNETQMDVPTPKCKITVPVWAGQHDNVGYVYLQRWSTGDSINFEIETESNFQNLKIWVGTDTTLIPKAGGKNPIPGQFPYKFENLNTNYFSGKIIYPYACDVWVLIHVDYGNETAWAGNIFRKNNSKWYYMFHLVNCCI